MDKGEQPEPIIGNKRIEDAAIRFVIEQERRAGRDSREVREAQQNAEFYVYVVENVAQGDPSKFELRVLAVAQLRELIATGREHRYLENPVRASEYAKLPRLER